MKLFRFIAFLEGVSYLLLLFIASPIKYFYGDVSYVKMLGMPHGIRFVAYVGLALYFMQMHEWTLKKLIIVLLGAVIPFGTFYIDKKYLRV
jgi:integral membrane protein